MTGGDEYRVFCGKCTHHDEKRCICRRWNINRYPEDSEPIEGKFNPVQHSCYQYKGNAAADESNEQPEVDWEGNEESLEFHPTPVGSLTPRMVNGLLYRMLQDCDGLAVTQDFFDNMPKSLPISAQYDETNGLWQFCVRKPRARQPILKPNRKVITDV